MKNLKKSSALVMTLAFFVLVSCDKEPTFTSEVAKQEVQTDATDNGELDEVQTDLPTTSFNITISNVVNYLNAYVFNTPDGASEPGPIADPGCFYSVDFKAVPGTHLSFATMSVVSNDWFFAPSGAGIPLFKDGVPVTGDVTEYVSLWDAGVEEEDPATVTSAPGGAEAGVPDDDNTIRIVEPGCASLIQVRLDYDETTKYFTLKIINVRGGDVSSYPIVISPGIVVLHAQNEPLFTEGYPDRGHGLAKIAVQGNPSPLYDWLTESCSTGAPLRMSSSFTVFSPGIAYAFDGEYDPVFREGEAAIPGSGVEDLAEDGNNAVLYDYITDQLGLPAAKSNEMMPIGPGHSLTFTLDVPQGYKLGYSTMFVFSNDWFLAHGNAGHTLFEDDGTPRGGMQATAHTYLFDAGTEVDQPVGFGVDQAPFQSGPNTGAPDENERIRRVGEIDDIQFGKGPIESPAGVTGFEDPRGGYNLVKVTVTPN